MSLGKPDYHVCVRQRPLSNVYPRDTQIGDDRLPVHSACCLQGAPAGGFFETAGGSGWCPPTCRRGLLAPRTVGTQTLLRNHHPPPGLQQSSEHPRLTNARLCFQTNSHGLAESAQGSCSLLVTVVRGVPFRDQGSP